MFYEPTSETDSRCRNGSVYDVWEAPRHGLAPLYECEYLGTVSGSTPGHAEEKARGLWGDKRFEMRLVRGCGLCGTKNNCGIPYKTPRYRGGST